MQAEIPINQLDAEDTFTPYVAGKQTKKIVSKQDPEPKKEPAKEPAVQEPVQESQPAESAEQKVTKRSGRPKKKKE